MFVRGGTRIARGLSESLFRPSRFVTVETRTYSSSRGVVLSQLAHLGLVWIVNLTLYAVPLTLSGIGFTSEATAPPAFARVVGVAAEPNAVWQFTVGLLTNSAYLTAATALVFVVYHGTVLMVRRSRGIFQSLHTVVYTTSIYLAGIFTVVMFVTTTPGLERTRRVLVHLQSNFIVDVINLIGADLTVASARPGPVVLDGISPAGEVLLALLGVLSIYFFYSLYLGARINHEMSRHESGLVVLAIGLAPPAYVVASALLAVATDGGILFL